MIVIAGRGAPFVVDFGRRKSGLATVGYELLHADGTVAQARSTLGVRHVADGIYMVELEIAGAFAGAIVWDTGEEEPIRAAEEIEAAHLDYLDATVSSRATVLNLANTTISVVGPVSTTGEVTILEGDDYLAPDARALVWKDSSAARWPSLAQALVTLEVLDPSRGLVLQVDGSAFYEQEGAGPGQEAIMEIHGALTEGHAGSFRYRLSAVLLDGSGVTLATGPFVIQSPYA